MVRVVAVALVLSVGANASADVTVAVDWADFLADQDLVWEGLPTEWSSGSFLGNGLSGAMIYEDRAAQSLRFDLGRADVWDHQSGGGVGGKRAGKTRLLIGALHLVPVGAIDGGTMRLDLWNADTTATIRTRAGTIALRSFITDDGVLVVDATATRGETGFSWRFASEPARSPWGNDPPHPNPAPMSRSDFGVHTVEQPLLAGGGFAVAWTEQVLSESHRILFLDVGWDRSGGSARDQAVGAVQAALATPMDDLVETHRTGWHAYYPESFLSVPDPPLQRFYWIQVYKLAAATRSDGPIYDLLGPWPTHTRWPGLWWNLNVQMTYWPVYAANRLELGESLVEGLARALDEGALAANEPDGAWQLDSGALATSTGDDLRDGYPLLESCDLPWAAHNVWLQYRYSGDETILRDRVVPLLLRAMSYYLHRLSEAPVAGRLNLPAARSPEYGVGPNPTIDVALLRWGLTTLLDADARLDLQSPQRPLWEATLAQMVDFPVDETGLMIASDLPLARSHRTFSHLLPIFPLHLLTVDDPDQATLITKSIERWTGRGEAGLFGPHPDRSGFSLAGASSLYATVGRGDDALDYLHATFGRLSSASMTPNTFYVEQGNPTSETPMAAASALQDLLIQSWGDRIRVFPALPSGWSDVSFHDLRAEGAFLVSAVRTGGRTQFIRIESQAGAPCRVQSDLPTPWQALGAPDITVKMEGEQRATIDLRKGESVILVTAGSDPDLHISPVSTSPPTAIVTQDGGCGCDLAGRSDHALSTLVLLLGWGWVIVRHRRRPGGRSSLRVASTREGFERDRLRSD